MTKQTIKEKSKKMIPMEKYSFLILTNIFWVRLQVKKSIKSMIISYICIFCDSHYYSFLKFYADSNGIFFSFNQYSKNI